MVDEILKEVALLEDIEGAKSECVLLGMHPVKVQRVQKSILNERNGVKDFDLVKQNMLK